jgi:hypothetical protein
MSSSDLGAEDLSVEAITLLIKNEEDALRNLASRKTASSPQDIQSSMQRIRSLELKRRLLLDQQRRRSNSSQSTSSSKLDPAAAAADEGGPGVQTILSSQVSSSKLMSSSVSSASIIGPEDPAPTAARLRGTSTSSSAGTGFATPPHLSGRKPSINNPSEFGGAFLPSLLHSSPPYPGLMHLKRRFCSPTPADSVFSNTPNRNDNRFIVGRPVANEQHQRRDACSSRQSRRRSSFHGACLNAQQRLLA